MSDTAPPQLLPAQMVSENGQKRRPRLLLVQPLVGIGDMVWHKPWIDYLAQSYDVILATKPTVQPTVLFSAEDQIADFLMIDRSMRGKRGAHDGVLGFFRMVAAFRAARADLCLIMHHSARYTLAAQLAGIPARWGYGIGRSARWLNRGSFLGRGARYQHPSSKMKVFADINGFAPPELVWRITTNASAKAAATAFLQDHDIVVGAGSSPIITYGVGAMDTDRQWSPAAFAEVILAMRKAFPGITSVLVGAPSEQPVMEAIQGRLPPESVVLSAMLSFDAAIDLLRRSLLFVGNDSSLLNIAAACDRPAIGLFAQSKPLDYNPNIKAVSVPDGRYGVRGGIASITPDQVFNAITAELRQIDDVAFREMQKT